MKQDSCFINRFRYYTDLDDKDETLLLSLERSPERKCKGITLWEEGDKTNELYILSKGWACSHRQLEDGSQQIFEVFLPGDIIGLREFAFNKHLTSVVMLDEGVICPFPHRHLIDVFHESAVLSTIFLAISSQHQALLTERLLNLAKRSARQKIAHFFYEIFLRLQRFQSLPIHTFHVPLSQQQIGDYLGLSSVHVSRTFREFREEGLILRERQWIEFPDHEALACEAQFATEYLTSDISHLMTQRVVV
ncbi:MAG TPA: Crp/Fnr family transcriptional regulator [Modicisalibacter sp.]|nr:Crp/Fnr family transcriptional regulator [Modicisalibacter sp.]